MPATAPYDDVADWYENTVVNAAFTLERLSEGASPTPVVLSLQARTTDG